MGGGPRKPKRNAAGEGTGVARGRAGGVGIPWHEHACGIPSVALTPTSLSPSHLMEAGAFRLHPTLRREHLHPPTECAFFVALCTRPYIPCMMVCTAGARACSRAGAAASASDRRVCTSSRSSRGGHAPRAVRRCHTPWRRGTVDLPPLPPAPPGVHPRTPGC